jgi:hypothetical protein
MTAARDQLEAPANIALAATMVPPWQRYTRRLVVIDVVGVVMSAGLAQWLRFGGLQGAVRSYPYIDCAVVSNAIVVSRLLALSINNSRSPRVIGSGAEEYRRVWLAALTVFGGVAIISMLFKLDIARGYLMIALSTGAVLILFGWIARRLVALARQKIHERSISVMLRGT